MDVLRNDCPGPTRKRLRGSKVMRQGSVDTLIIEEPDDRIGHVRICGGGMASNGCLYPDRICWVIYPGAAERPIRISRIRLVNLGHPPPAIAFRKAQDRVGHRRY